jgi:RHS repeat-associated protein
LTIRCPLPSPFCAWIQFTFDRAGNRTQQSIALNGEATDSKGLVYLRARYYAPGIGQFVSIDPLETANRYAYVGGNVVNATDPSGLVAASPLPQLAT